MRHLGLLRPLVLVAGLISCSKPSSLPNKVDATYDKTSGKLVQLTVNAVKDGKPNIYSYMDGTRFLRIEIDNDEDGKIDRWEYYGSNQKIEKVGMSRSNDGKQDSWAYQAPDGTVSKIEMSTHRDGKVNRIEFYEKGALARVEEDTDGDGRPDKWETYENGTLATAAFDTTHSGAPDKTIDYREEAKK
jgi:antitoxin component YwqK of YwqJK toxin-antitoxin module